MLAEALTRLPPRQRALCIEVAESLPAELIPDRDYPVEWIAFRLGTPAAAAGISGVIRGDRVLADLSAVVERLCEASRLIGKSLPPGSRTAPELCALWAISPKTLARYRQRGLVARRVHDPGGRTHLAFTPAAVGAFEQRSTELLNAAAGFSRIARDDEARMIRRARRYRCTLRCSLNGAALRLARRFGRSHEAVRRLLQRHDAAAANPIFGRPARAIDARRELAYRAMRRGIEPAEVAHRTRRTRAAVVRLANDRRAAVLRELGLASDAPDSPDDSTSAKALAPSPVRTELGAPGETDLAALVATVASPTVPIGVVERTRAAAYRALIARAGSSLASLPAHGVPGPEIDRVETDLRWAARLKAELVRAQLTLMARTIEGQLGVPLGALRAADLAPLLNAMIAAVAGAVENFDPSGRGRLAAPVGLAVQRAASRWVREHPEIVPAARPQRAAPVLRPGFQIPDWTLTLCPWQPCLEPDPRVRPALRQLPETEQHWLLERFGWSGGPPRTLDEMAAHRGIKPMHAAKKDRAAVRAGLHAARAGRPA